MTIYMILVYISETFQRIFYKSHDRLTENVPFTNHKNKYFTVQVIAYTMVHVISEQGKSVI